MNHPLAPSPAADPAGSPEPLAGWRSTVAGGLVRTARPKQWLKNVLVFAAPGAAGVLRHGDVLVDALAAFAIFCLVASGVYFLNDALDVESDRLHPRKCRRPVAAGVIGVGQAVAIGAALVGAGLVLAALVGWRVLVVMGAYVGVQVAYTLWLKHEPVFDLAAVASGFVLRAIAGGVAAGVPISEWFLIVATFGSLFMVTGKRVTEYVNLGEGRADVRASLAGYSVAFLRSVLVMSMTVTVTAYCLWAFENVKAHEHGSAIWFQLSIVPFTLAMLRYGLDIDQGRGGEPEDLVLTDRLLQILGLAWIAVFALGVYG
ncbi:MAG: decaprenyl-phosphate phosphoribosyltransferase [Actinomycetota bacterium]|nr:decaprenyl-phosphate phosphoribosyltransferase [Actinomycetota bacterium]